jgi:hypothetical protein
MVNVPLACSAAFFRQLSRSSAFRAAGPEWESWMAEWMQLAGSFYLTCWLNTRPC